MATLPNYFLDGGTLPDNPFQTGVMEGLQFSTNLQNVQAANLQRQQLQQEAALKLQAQQRAQEQQAELQTLLSNPTPASTKDLLRISALLPKDQSASVMSVYDKLTADQQQSKIKQAGQIYASMKSGNLDVTKSLLQQQADAARNSGNEEEAKAAETYIKMLDINPTGAQNTIGVMMAVLPGGKEALENIDKTFGTTRAEELQPTAVRKATAEAESKETEAKFAAQKALAELEEKKWNVKKAQSEIARAAAQTKLDTQRLALDTATKLNEIAQKGLEIPEFAQKDINAAAVESASATQTAAKYNNLAQRLEAAGGGFGSFTSANEWLREATGRQSPRTLLFKEYEQLKNQGVLDALPAGSSTDTDIRIAQRGFLPANADAKELASFLRGMAKLKQIESNISNAKVDWLAQNKGVLTKPKTTIVVGNYTAKPGESFSDLSMRIATDTAKQFRSPDQLAEEQRQRMSAQLNAIDAPRGAAPAPPASSVRAQADAILGGAR